MNIDKQWFRANYKGEELFTIPDSVTSIDYETFYDCRSLKSIIIPNGVMSIGYKAFWGTSLESISIPDSVTKIGDYAFCGCRSLKSIIIPNGVTSIGDGAFKYCTSLESVTIPDSVTSIGTDAFCGCRSLKSIIIPNGVMSIGNDAFENCESLKSITIPDGVTSIGYGVFYGCKSLKKITIPDSVTSIDIEAFCGCKTIITYNEIAYPSYVFSRGGNIIPFIRTPSYENLMRIEDVSIKTRLALDYVDSEDKRFMNYTKGYYTVLIKQSAKNEDWDALDKIFNSEHKLLRPEQLDECIKFAVENNYHELFILLMQYKENTGNYDKDDNRFELGVMKEK